MIRHLAVSVLFSLVATFAWSGEADPTDVNKSSSSLASESLVQVLRTTNKAQVNKFVCEALPFKNVNPYNVINFFWAATSREEGGIYSFVHPTDPYGYIVVICPEYQLPWLRELAKELDRPQLTSAPGSKYIYYRMKHRNSSDAGFRTVVSYYTGASGVLIPDLETNSLLIFDAPDGAMAAEEALNEIFDKPLSQIEVQVSFYEIDVHNDAALGLDFEDWKNGPGKNLAQYAARGQYFKTNSGPRIDSSTSGSGVYLDYPSAYFDFLVDKGKAKTLLNTKITAITGVPALLTTGEQFLFYKVDTSLNDREVEGKTKDMETGAEVFPSDGRVFRASDKPFGQSGLRGVVRSPFRSVDPSYPQAQYPQNRRPISSAINAVDTGILLGLVPTIGTNVTNLDLDLRVISVNGFDNQGVPLLNSRQMRDSIAVANGEEVVFGGFTRERTIQTTQKIPFLGTLPVVGYLFGHEITTKTRKMVVAAVRPVPVIKHDNITEDDQLLVRQANEDEVVVLPETEFMFDQSFRILH